MSKINVGILGQDGFLGTHLYSYLRLKENIVRVPSSKAVFDSLDSLDNFVENCNTIVHFAGKSRGENQEEIYSTNMELTHKLIDAIERKKTTPVVLFGSTIHEERNSLYHKSKRDADEALQKWAKKNKATAITLIMPNTFGPYCKPNFNSFVSTFCYNIAKGEKVKIINDSIVDLIYVDDLCSEISTLITKGSSLKKYYFKKITRKKVSEILSLLESFKLAYIEKKEIPPLKDCFELSLFNTFLHYLNS